MLRHSLVVLERDERAVLRCLGRLGVVQLTRSQSGPGTAPFAPRDRSKELARCDHLLARVEELRRSLEIVPLIAEVTEPVEPSLEEADERISLNEKRADDLLQRRAADLFRVEEEIPGGQLLEEEIPSEPQQEEPAAVYRDAAPDPEHYIRQGNYHQALTAYKAILSENPDDRQIRQRMAELKALFKILGKDQQEHIMHLEKFLDGIRKRRDEFIGST